MCMVSNIGDYYTTVFPNPMSSSPSKEEFDERKRQVEKMKRHLQMAKELDEATGQKDCEMEHKIKRLRELAKQVGIDLDDVFIKRV